VIGQVTGYLRQFAPAVLAAVRFAGGPGTEQVLQAVAMLAELYAIGARKVPAGALVGFVPATLVRVMSVRVDCRLEPRCRPGR